MNEERLKKIYALAMEGVGGEKEVALKLLDKLAKKYKFDVSELEDEQINEYIFEFHGKEELQLLVQCAYKVTDVCGTVHQCKYTYSNRALRTKRIISCTEAQKAEIQLLFDFYKALWEKEREFFLMAFIQKHRLFGAYDGKDDGKKLSKEELVKLYMLMDGLSDSQPLKQLEEKE